MTMKTLKISFLAAVFCAALHAFCAGKILVAGSGWDRIMLLDRATGKAEWTYKIPAHSECNGAVLSRDGLLFYSNKKNARLAAPSGETVWEYPAADGEEIQSAVALKNGNFLVAICGRPARIVELSKDGRPVRQAEFDTGVKNVHGQFRQVSVTRRNTYLLSIMDRKTAVELDKNGKFLREIPASFSAFSTKELPGGNWLLSGSGGHVQEINPKTGEVVRDISNKNLKGAKLLYATEAVMLKNGNILVANWNGHSDDKSQPKLVEIDRDDNVVWSLDSPEDIKNISAFFVPQR